MKPLIILAIATLIARSVGAIKREPCLHGSGAIRVGLAVMFCFTAVAHFTSLRAEMVLMIPPFVQAPDFVVSFTGVCEIIGAIALLIPRTRRLAGIALILFLIAVLPANIYAAISGATLGGSPVTPLVPRIGIQILYIALIWWVAVRAPEVRGADSRRAKVIPCPEP